jgi:hypothetical protein
LSHLLNLTLLMEGLFAKRYHIKGLTFGTAAILAKSRLMPDFITDLKLLSVYAKPYNQEEVETTVR